MSVELDGRPPGGRLDNPCQPSRNEKCKDLVLFFNKVSLKFAQCRPRIQQMRQELDAAYNNIGYIEKFIDQLSDRELLEAFLIDDEIEPLEMEKKTGSASKPDGVTTSNRAPSTTTTTTTTAAAKTTATTTTAAAKTIATTTTAAAAKTTATTTTAAAKTTTTTTAAAAKTTTTTTAAAAKTTTTTTAAAAKTTTTAAASDNTQTKNVTGTTAGKPLPPPINKLSMPARAKNATGVSSQATVVRPSQAEPRGQRNKLDHSTKAQHHGPLLPVKIKPRCDEQETVADLRLKAIAANEQTRYSTFQAKLSKFAIHADLPLTSRNHNIDTPASRTQRQQKQQQHQRWRYIPRPSRQGRRTRNFLSVLDAASKQEQHFRELSRAQILSDENKVTDQTVEKRGVVAEDTTNPKVEDVPTHHPANDKGKDTVTQSRAALKESNPPDSDPLSAYGQTASNHHEQRSTRLKRAAATKVVSYTESSLANRNHYR